MTVITQTMECLSPCFCAGANQAEAEIRPASIRGNLRWWFRLLGGTRELETEVFGGTAGGDRGRASAIQVRVTKVKAKRPKAGDYSLKKYGPNDTLGYYFFLASKSGDGKRWTPTGQFAPGTTFELQIRFLRPLSAKARAAWEDTWRVFRNLGAIGMRTSRGLGALQAAETQFEDQTVAILKKHGITFQLCGVHSSEREVFIEAEKWLKNGFRKSFPLKDRRTKEESPSPLGGAETRQTSAVYFRPIKFKAGLFQLFLFEVPHTKVLGKASRRPSPIIAGIDPRQPPSADSRPPRRRGRHR